MTHPSHKTRFSDSSLFDEVCIYCNGTDASGDTSLERPCRNNTPERILEVARSGRCPNCLAWNAHLDLTKEPCDYCHQVFTPQTVMVPNSPTTKMVFTVQRGSLPPAKLSSLLNVLRTKGFPVTQIDLLDAEGGVAESFAPEPTNVLADKKRAVKW